MSTPTPTTEPTTEHVVCYIDRSHVETLTLSQERYDFFVTTRFFAHEGACTPEELTGVATPIPIVAVDDPPAPPTGDLPVTGGELWLLPIAAVLIGVGHFLRRASKGVL